MSTQYRRPEDVPTEVLCRRLLEFAKAIAKGPDCARRECDMRIPAEVDRDLDLVCLEVVKRLSFSGRGVEFDPPGDTIHLQFLHWSDVIRKHAEGTQTHSKSEPQAND